MILITQLLFTYKNTKKIWAIESIVLKNIRTKQLFIVTLGCIHFTMYNTNKLLYAK